jgi:hypothetical protein
MRIKINCKMSVIWLSVPSRQQLEVTPVVPFKNKIQYVLPTQTVLLDHIVYPLYFSQLECPDIEKKGNTSRFIYFIFY